MVRYHLRTIKYIFFAIILFNALIFNLSVASASYSAGTLVTLTNSARAQNGLGALSTNSALAAAAYAKAQDIIAKDYFAHNSPSGQTPWDFITDAGYSYSYAGENLAIGYTDANELFSAWMASPTHRDNILNPNFREIGVVVISGEFQGVETLVAVQEFGAAANNQTSAQEVAAEASPTSPTPTPSAPENQNETFEFEKDKSDFSPKSIFSGETVEFKVTVSGQIKTLEMEVFDKKFNILEVGSVTGSAQEKTYILKQKIENVGSSEVKVVAKDQNGDSDTLNLGTLEVKETVIAKVPTQNKVGLLAGFKESVQNNWVIYAIAFVFVLASIVLYLTLRKYRFSNLASSWRL